MLGCGGLSVLWGCSIGWNAYKVSLDFQAVYFGARTLIEHHDPYIVGELDSVFMALKAGDGATQGDAKQHKLITLFVNTPGDSTFWWLHLLFCLLGFCPGAVDDSYLWKSCIGERVDVEHCSETRLRSPHVLLDFLLLNCQVFDRLRATLQQL